MANKSKNILLQKLDEFIRKYYKNQLIKGSIYALTGFLVALILVATLEYFGHFDTITRTILFYSFSTFTIYILAKYVAIPLAKLNKIGSVINHEQASHIIGNHFPNVKDKLLNTIQLQQSTEQSSLLAASVEHRIQELNPVPFTGAINLKDNIRYLRYAVLPVLAIMAILIISPGLIMDSTERIVKHNQHFEKQAPFSFNIESGELEAVQNEDFNLKLKLGGDEIPADVTIVVDDNSFIMDNMSTVEFEHTFKNLQKDVKFYFTADGFSSKEYTLKVLPQPLLLNFEVTLNYPAYIGKKNEKLDNAGDITIPEGTEVTWSFNTINSDYLSLSFKDTSFTATQQNKDLFRFNKRFLDNSSYFIKTSNKLVEGRDSILYNISVTPDAYPSIQVEEKPDSLSNKIIYFFGNIDDDHGFRRLTFNYKFLNAEDKSKLTGATKSINISINGKDNQQSFFHLWDLSSLNIKAADEIEYYFEVWDNDGVNGSKSTKSRVHTFKAPTKEELEANANKNNEQIKSKMSDAFDEMKELNDEINKLQKQLIEKKKLDWEDKQKLNKLMEKHDKLQEQLKEIQQQNQENNQEQSDYKEQNQKILEKQQELQKLFDELLDDETKKLFEEMQKLMEEQNKDKLQEKLDELEFNDKELEKELDKALEQFKQLEIEQKMQEQVDKLKELAKEQEELSEKTEKKEESQEELKKQQDELNEKFDEIQKDIEDVEKKNQELEKPLEWEKEKTEEKAKEAEENMQKSSQDLGKKQNQKAAQKQKEAAKKMQEIAEQMEKSMQQAQQKQMAEDYNTLREILENLIQISFDQEELIVELKKIRSYNPKYIEITEKQKALKDDAKVIEDSLLALSKRQPMIKNFINREIGLINENLSNSVVKLGKRNTGEGLTHQQYAMTSMNNLAVMLSEVLSNMQDQMNANTPASSGGDGQTPKPGQGPPNFSNMKQLQEQMKKQLENLQKGMEKGSNPGGVGPGGQGKEGLSEELSKIAAQQEALRRKLKQVQDKLGKDGEPGKFGDLQKTQDLMEQMERDLVKGNLTPQMLERQKEILTRLLEHEKAEREQKTDNERKANEGKEKERTLPPSLEKYIEQKNKEQELLRTLPPTLSPYYKQKVKEYYKKLETE